MLRNTALACLAGSAFVATVSAHHAFVAQYDADKPAQLNGVVVKIEWLNPHTYFFVDVQDGADGSVETWAIEMGSPVALMRRGWTRNSMKIGDVVTVDGILARDGGAALNAQSVVLDETGQKLFTRSRAEQQQVESGSAESAQ